MDDSTLLAAWSTGDKHAGTILAERHFAGLYRFFRSKIAGDVDDLVQQTFMSCLEARPAFRGDCSFRTLLFRIARRRLLDHYRKKQATSELEFTTASARALGTTPTGALQRRDERSAIHDALQELPVDSQMLLQLRYWEDLSTQDLAEIFDVSIGTIKSRQFGARARLRAALAARGHRGVEQALPSGPAPAATRD